jgi:hypothetical protein
MRGFRGIQEKDASFISALVFPALGLGSFAARRISVHQIADDRDHNSSAQYANDGAGNQ